MPHAKCLRTARSLLGWSTKKAASRANVPQQRVFDAEDGRAIGPLVLHRLVMAYEKAGISFIADDVKLHAPEMEWPAVQEFEQTYPAPPVFLI